MQTRTADLYCVNLLGGLRLLMLIVIAAGLVWLVFGLVWPRIAPPEKDPVARTR